MKYKLINLKTKEEHLCNKVTIDGYEYYVSDEVINQGDYYIDFRTDGNKLEHFKEKNDLVLIGICGSKKVIATNNPNIDIPKVVNEVEMLAYEHCDTVIPKDVTRSLHYFFKCGYNKSQEIFSFREEDMIEFSEWKDYNFYQHIEDNLYRTMQARPMYKVLENKYYTLKELLQIWKEQKNITLYYE